MIKELEANPDLGLISARPDAAQRLGRSAVLALVRAARPLRARRGPAHLPAWKKWNKASRESGAVGIWHETYKVHAGEYEVVYGNMPRHGLATATAHCAGHREGPLGRAADRRDGGGRARRRLSRRLTRELPARLGHLRRA